jgi:hypothetical protein
MPPASFNRFDLRNYLGIVREFCGNPAGRNIRTNRYHNDDELEKNELQFFK